MTYAWHDLGDGRQVYRRVTDEKPARSSLPCPMIVLDTMDPIQSMADGKIYDSKSALRAGYKQGGFVEVGNERPKPKVRKSHREGIRESLMKAKARVST